MEKHAVLLNNLESTCPAKFASNYVTTQYKGSKCEDGESDRDEKSGVIKLQDKKVLGRNGK